MCSSRQKPNKRAADVADRLGSAAGWAALLLGGLLACALAVRESSTLSPGEIRIHSETVLRFSPVAMPEIQAAPRPAPATEISPKPEPEPEPMPAPQAEPAPVVPGQTEEAMSSEPAQPEMDREGEQGREDAIRTEWLGELRRRIEQNKYYPGAARYSREAGTVWVRVVIGKDGMIGPLDIRENTGSDFLAEGARGILRRAAAEPLGTNMLPGGFFVDVPITYRLDVR